MMEQRTNNWLLVLIAFSVFLIGVALFILFWLVPSDSEGAEESAAVATSGEQRVLFSDLGMT